MTTLTEKWQKGELSDRWYYVKNDSGDIHPSEYMKEYVSINGCVVFGFLNEVSEITEVIDKVPTYEEYQALLSDQLAKNEGVEINSELKAIIKKREIKIKELYETIDKFADSNLDLIKNIENLAKKLLQVKPELRDWLEVNFKEYL